jgi:hypothetical protein
MKTLRTVGRSRFEFSNALTSSELDSLVNQTSLQVLQCSSPVSDSIWPILNDFFSRRPDVLLRVYGFYSTECDLGFAATMTNVRRFAADCLRTARNVDAIAEMSNLESLSLGIFDLQDFDVLEHLNQRLTELSIGATRSKKPDLAPLRRFGGLRRLYLEGHTKNIEVLSQLANLEELTLRSITTPDLRYLASLGSIWSLDIKLGGIRSFGGIEDKGGIKYLELWQIRQLIDVDIISRLPGLQNLFLQSLPRIRVLPCLTTSHNLRRVVLENMKGLVDLSALEFAPALEDFALVDGVNQDPEQLRPILRNPALRRASAHFGSARKNDRFLKLLQEHGKDLLTSFRETFNYR